MLKSYEYRVKCGTHRHNKKSYKVGETFKSEFELNIKNKLVLVGSPEDLAERRANANQPTIVKSSEAGRFNVLDEDGAIYNEKPLTKKQAATALAGLIAESIEDDEDVDNDDEDDENDDD